MKRVLIPTDFTVQSLQLIDYAILNFPNDILDIILISGFELNENLWSMRNYSEQREVNKLCSESYTKAKRIFLREHRDNIERLHIRLFTGHNNVAFQNFVDQNALDTAIIAGEGFLQYQQSRAFDSSTYIKACIKNIIEIPLEQKSSYKNPQLSISTIYNL